jgi:DNA polymerase-1
MPTNAIYGFIRMFLKLIKDQHPTHIGVIFDSPKRTFRDDLFSEYKANRTEAPSDLIVQIPYIYRVIDAFRIKSIVREGFEADDVIATLASQAVKKKIDSVIITADKDFMQIVGPHTRLWDPMRDKSTGTREVRERFGVEPRSVIEIQSLMGDSIDNIKGVPGVGEKTATALIQEFGSIDNLYKNLDKVEQTKIRGAKKVAALLAEHRESALLARKLVTIDTEVPLDLAPEDFAWPGIDQHALSELLRELEFNSLLQELTPSASVIPVRTGEEVEVTADSLDAVLTELKRAPRLALHLGENAIGAAKLKISGDAKTYLFDTHLIGATAPLLNDPSPPKEVHDLKTHVRKLCRFGIRLAGVDFDTMIAGFLVNSGKPEPSLNDLYHEHLAGLSGGAPSGSEPAIIAALRQALMLKLERDGLGALFHDIEMPAAMALAEMEECGIKVDASALKTMSQEFGDEANRLERECYDLAGREFNLNSPIQLREVLFNHLKLTVKGLKKTKSGYSTDADSLEKLAAVHPMPRKLLEYRSVAKLKSTYSDSLGTLIDPKTGRIHTTFHQALTATGRLSSSDPNLQNIPTRTEDGMRIRRAFVAEDGHVLLSADYSQIDLRVLAHLSGDPTLTGAFQSGEDIHVRTAVELLQVKPDNVDLNARRIAKVINFGIIYGMGPQRLAGELGIPLLQASEYIKRYFERLEGVRTFIEGVLSKARETGFVTTMYGRRRYLPELRSPEGGARAQAERIATNTPIQGTAADLIKVAMIRLSMELERRDIKAKMLLQVHDELLLEVEADSLAETKDVVKKEMEGAAELLVPLKADLKWGPNWAQLST